MGRVRNFEEKHQDLLSCTLFMLIYIQHLLLWDMCLAWARNEEKTVIIEFFKEIIMPSPREIFRSEPYINKDGKTIVTEAFAVYDFERDKMISNPSPSRKIKITYVKPGTPRVGEEIITKGFCTYDADKNPVYHDDSGKAIKKEHVIEWSYLKS